MRGAILTVMAGLILLAAAAPVPQARAQEDSKAKTLYNSTADASPQSGAQTAPKPVSLKNAVPAAAKAGKQKSFGEVMAAIARENETAAAAEGAQLKALAEKQRQASFAAARPIASKRPAADAAGGMQQNMSAGEAPGAAASAPSLSVPPRSPQVPNMVYDFNKAKKKDDKKDDKDQKPLRLFNPRN